MQEVYTQETYESTGKSIFLAGPSPRSNGDYNWRPGALKILQTLGFEGAVYIPLPRDGNWPTNYDDQVEWELKHLNAADIIVFWIPRDVKNLPGFTTNVEFGMFAQSGKIVLGYPENAEKMTYLHHIALKFNVPVCSTLEETLKTCLEKI